MLQKPTETGTVETHRESSQTACNFVSEDVLGEGEGYCEVEPLEANVVAF
jgi:hypothetical protein